ncbi:collagen alpha-1(I) chain-like [Mustela erminea]|uniref:collagen alpha-1(I) chain-like n=1 Tax=Mustela erminea TaxID=36723 RepID=UPI001386DCB9|nr:collagen alpha-1(I) chain-like [Mustela erminea]
MEETNTYWEHLLGKAAAPKSQALLSGEPSQDNTSRRPGPGGDPQDATSHNSSGEERTDGLKGSSPSQVKSIFRWPIAAGSPGSSLEMQTLGGVGPSPLHFNKPARQAPNALRPLGTQKCEKLGPVQPGKPGAMAPVRSASPTLPGTKQVAPTCQRGQKPPAGGEAARSISPRARACRGWKECRLDSL